jgi:hypothetical protein
MRNLFFGGDRGKKEMKINRYETPPFSWDDSSRFGERRIVAKETTSQKQAASINRKIENIRKSRKRFYR